MKRFTIYILLMTCFQMLSFAQKDFRHAEIGLKSGRVLKGKAKIKGGEQETANRVILYKKQKKAKTEIFTHEDVAYLLIGAQDLSKFREEPNPEDITMHKYVYLPAPDDRHLLYREWDGCGEKLKIYFFYKNPHYLLSINDDDFELGQLTSFYLLRTGEKVATKTGSLRSKDNRARMIEYFSNCEKIEQLIVDGQFLNDRNYDDMIAIMKYYNEETDCE